MEALTPRIVRLRARLNDYVRETGQRIVRSDDEQRAYAELAHESLVGTDGEPEVLRKAARLDAFAERMPVSIGDDELIVGSQRFTGHAFGQYLTEEQCRQMAFRGNAGHLIVDYGRVLREGVRGLRERVAAMPDGDEVQRRNREAFGRTVEAFSLFVRRHGEAGEWIAEQPPRTFHEALQLLWFVQIFLHAEGNAAAVSFGRFDQFMWPFLERDLRDGVTTMREAEELLSCFWLKCCEGDESQNLTLGGVDAAGESAENPLCLLCLEVTRKLGVWQPSVSVRIGPETSEAFWRAALELCATGIGMPSFFNDPVVVRSLRALDLPLDRARDWGIVGCYEATPQGDTYGLTTGGGLTLPSLLLEYLVNGGPKSSYEELRQGLRQFVSDRYGDHVAEYQAGWDGLARDCPSPFESLCLTGCLESGLTSQEGGGRHNLFGINILGLGTLVDSLLVLKEVVYESGRMTLDDFVAQMRDDFQDESTLSRCRNLTGKYGADSAASNELAADLSRYVADLVLDSRMENGVRPDPGFFRFLADVHMPLPATPDGRRDNDRISYGCGPGVYCSEATPTTIVNSAANVAHDRCACGNPLTLSLNRSDVEGETGRQRLRQLIETYFAKGGFHLHFNIVDADQLRAAQADPQEHTGLTVRISGFSARFVTLEKQLQDAIIERTERGM